MPFQECLNLSLKYGLVDLFVDDVYKRLPKIIRIPEFSPEFTAKFLDLTKHSMVPEIVVGHFSHLDHIVVSDFCRKLMSLSESAGLKGNLTGFVETLASSVLGGQQSKFLEAAYSKMVAYAKERGLEFVPVTRDADVERYNMSKTLSELRPLVSRLRQKGMGALIPPGGSVQPGRHPKGASGDQIYGLQEITDTSILDLYDIMKSSGKRSDPPQQPYFLPLAINRTYRVLSSDSLLPTPEGAISLYDLPSRILSYFGFQRMMIYITPGMPLTEEDMQNNLGSTWRDHPKESVDFIMAQVAKELPPNARGYYGSFVQD